jgi:hypothetical protein
LSRIPAGEFGAWLATARASLSGASGSEVPCGDCVGCCVSSYHIALRTQDRVVLRRVPAQFLHQQADADSDTVAWMGFRADGRCPMLGEDGCSVYADRPQTCRDYDCRVFAAAGMLAGDARRAVINERVQAWEFSYAGEAARNAHRAVSAAAAFIRDHAALLPPGWAPTGPTGIAVLALKVYTVFLPGDLPAAGDAALAAAVLSSTREFDAGLPDAGHATGDLR